MQYFKRTYTKYFIITLLLIWVMLICYGFQLAKEGQLNNLTQSRSVVEITNITHIEENKLEKEEQKLAMQPDPSASIVLLITELGDNKDLLTELVRLPKEVAFGFVPQANIEGELEALHNMGHDILIKMSFDHKQQVDSTDAYLLRNHFPMQENIKRLTFLIHKFNEITGVYSYDTPINEMNPIIDMLAESHLCYISTNLADSALEQYAKVKSYPFLVGDIVIDKSVIDLAAELELAEAKAIEDGSAIILLQLDAVKVSIIDNWIKNLHNKNITLIAISKLLPKNYI